MNKLSKILLMIVCMSFVFVGSVSAQEVSTFPKSFQPSVLVQTWFQAEHEKEWSDTFRLRRAEIKVKGDFFNDRLGYTVMVDPARVLEFQETEVKVDGTTDKESVKVKQPVGAASMLQDVYVAYRFDYIDFSMGQFKTPVSWEGFNSSSKLLFAERDMVSRKFGDKRDLGLTVSKKFKHISYLVGAYNGAALNNLDNNTGKEFGTRLEVYPTSFITLAGVAQVSPWQRDEKGSKDRYEADLRVSKDGLTIQNEFIQGRDANGTSDIWSRGYYTAVAYNIMGRVEPVVRVGYLDPMLDKNANPTADKTDESVHVDAGVNVYAVKDLLKLQLDYSHEHYQDKLHVNRAIAAAQLSF